MLSREWLCRRRCVRDLIQIFDGVFPRAAARWPIALDEPTVGLLLFWTILRGERTFLLRCLEQLGVDMWALTCEVDDLLRPSRAAAPSDATVEELETALERPLWAWLDRTEQQAVALGHPYLGTEHLLLAILAEAEEPLAAVLARHGLSHERVAGAVQAALAAGRAASGAATSEPPVVMAEAIEESDVAAVGVPRRFSLATLMLTMVTYAMLLAGLRAGGIPPAGIVMVLVLFTAAGVGQPVFYGGKNPRWASMLVGLVLLPIEMLVLLIYLNATGVYSVADDESIGYMILAVLFGGPLGYAAGCLAAGMFFLNDRYEKFKRCHAAPEQPEPDPLAPANDASAFLIAGESACHPERREGSG